MLYNITPTNKNKSEEIQLKIDNLVKPVGSLGKLEKVAHKLGLIQETLYPEISKPTIVTFAADHGIVEEGVSPCPKELTWQQVINFCNGGGGISVLCKQLNVDHIVVDSGTDYDFNEVPGLVDLKIRKSTRNFLNEPAMTREECDLAFKKASDLIQKVYNNGCNVIGFGEMGIGNTSPASILMSELLDIPLKECVGPGSGHNSEGVMKKYETLQKAVNNHSEITNPYELMQTFGGFEVAMMTASILKAAELKMTVLIDGFICTAAYATASAMYPDVKDYCIFSHQSDEGGHKLMLDKLGATALLNLDFRLGEGTGSAMAVPVLQASCAMINRMKSFNETKITNTTHIIPDEYAEKRMENI